MSVNFKMDSLCLSVVVELCLLTSDRRRRRVQLDGRYAGAQVPPELEPEPKLEPPGPGPGPELKAEHGAHPENEQTDKKPARGKFDQEWQRSTYARENQPAMPPTAYYPLGKPARAADVLTPFRALRTAPASLPPGQLPD